MNLNYYSLINFNVIFDKFHKKMQSIIITKNNSTNTHQKITMTILQHTRYYRNQCSFLYKTLKENIKHKYLFILK